MTAYDYEREEHRDALRYSETRPCYRHDYRSDRHGGVCIDCGDTVSKEEI